MNGELLIYKASAGSGKTYRLAAEYIKLILNRPDSYKNILAVTFTNKATGEMKERIMNNLYALSLNATPIAKMLTEETGMGEKEIAKRAKKALELILHDYSHFHIETIDSFFQSLLKNLARELGIGSGFNIELNNNAVIDEAVKNIIANCDRNEELRNWITNYVYECIDDENRSWDIRFSLNSFGKNIFNEKFKSNEYEIHKILGSDKNFIKKFKTEISKKIKDLKEELVNLAMPFFRILDNNALLISDCAYGDKGAAGYFAKIKNGETSSEKLLTKRVSEVIENPKKWGKKIPSEIASELSSLIAKTEEKRKPLSVNIHTFQLANKHINALGLLIDITDEVKRITSENNKFLLSDTGPLLSSMVKDEDASFIFEKAGNEFSHILFDEFQDTSSMQWDTFKPLLHESLSRGNGSLIVGDEKQSIYRWRNSDWKILGNINEQIAPFKSKENILEYNWRSEKNIVEFNNKFFKDVLSLAKERLKSNTDDFLSAYRSIEQKPVKKENKGYIECNFLSSDKTKEIEEGEEAVSYSEKVLKYLLEKVEYLQRSGIKPDDIAIIIRENKHIPEIAQYFSENKTDSSLCYDVISDEAFMLSSSKALQLLIMALCYLNKEDAVTTADIVYTYQNDILKNDTAKKILYEKTPDKYLPDEFTKEKNKLKHLPLNELIEELFRIFKLKEIKGQTSFINYFIDGVIDFLKSNAPDIPAFLTYWEETLSTKKVPAGAGINGIRILSIHKSKGLEYHTVIIPFCDWKLFGKKGEPIWCKTKTELLSKIPVLPINYSEIMNESMFHDEYQNEVQQALIDNINLLYVAFTRACKNLIIFCEGKKENSKKEITSVNNILSTILGDEQECYKYGIFEEETVEIQEDIKEDGISLIRKGNDLNLSFNNFQSRTKFRQSTKAMEFAGSIPVNNYIERGKLMHNLFSRINSVDDIKKKVFKAYEDTLITREEIGLLEKEITEALTSEDAKDWYSGKYKLYNECTILCRNKKGEITTRRPDRVMIGNGIVKIVDFKFGRPAAKYKYQVRDYIALMLEMGYKNIEGYIWYVDDRKIERV